MTPYVIRANIYTHPTYMQLYAADCAEHVLHIYEAEYPADNRPRAAIEAARAYARDEIDAVARDAALDAARTAMAEAVWSPAWAARPGEHPAWLVARAAARALCVADVTPLHGLEADAALAAAYAARGRFDAAAWQGTRGERWERARRAAHETARHAEHNWQIKARRPYGD